MRSAAEVRRARNSYVRKDFMGASSGDELSSPRGARVLSTASGGSSKSDKMAAAPSALQLQLPSDEEEPQQLMGRSPRMSRGAGRPPRGSEYRTPRPSTALPGAHPRVSEARIPRRSEVLMLLAFDGGDDGVDEPSPRLPRLTRSSFARMSESQLESHRFAS